MNHPEISLQHPYLALKSANDLIDSLQGPLCRYNNILQIMSPAHIYVTEAIASAWYALAYHTTNSHLASQEKVNVFSSIIHKLTCAGSQIQAIESIICEPLLDRINYDQKNLESLPPDVLEILQIIKNHISIVLNFTQPNHCNMEASLAFSWSQLCDHLDDKIPLSLEELNNLTASIHKLTPSYCKLRMLEVEAYQKVFKQAVSPSYPAAPEDIPQKIPPGAAHSIGASLEPFRCRENSPSPSTPIFPNTIRSLGSSAEVSPLSRPLQNSLGREESRSAKSKRTYIHDGSSVATTQKFFAQVELFKRSIIAANSQNPLPPPNNGGLDFVKKTKQALSEIIEIMSAGHTCAEKAIAFAWNSLHHLLTNTPPSHPKDLNIYSSIIHKLTTSTNQLKSIELKLFDRFLKQNFSKSKQQETEETFYYISPEDKKRFEEEVKEKFGAIVPC